MGEPTPRYRHATIDLFLDPAVRGRGLGGVENTAAISAYEKAGFTRVGVMRGYEREPDGPHWRDGLLMELLADDARA